MFIGLVGELRVAVYGYFSMHSSKFAISSCKLCAESAAHVLDGGEAYCFLSLFYIPSLWVDLSDTKCIFWVIRGFVFILVIYLYQALKDFFSCERVHTKCWFFHILNVWHQQPNLYNIKVQHQYVCIIKVS